MLTFGDFETLEAVSNEAGVQYTFSYAAIMDGQDTFDPDPLQGDVPTSVGAIWPALGSGLSAVARIMFSYAGSATSGAWVQLFKNGSTQRITAFTIPPGGTATFDGIEPRIFDADGIRQ